jgi:hypothetical protein
MGGDIVGKGIHLPKFRFGGKGDVDFDVDSRAPKVEGDIEVDSQTAKTNSEVDVVGKALMGM